MPCVQTAARKEHDEFVRRNRREVDLFEGLVDPVEKILRVHQPRRFDELIQWIQPIPTETLYVSLTPAQQTRLEICVSEFLDAGRQREAESIVRCLAAFTESDLAHCLPALVERGCFRPALAFRKAAPDVRDRLIQRVDDDHAQRNLILLALAWIGDETVLERMAGWRNRPPSWAGQLFVPPERYAHEAGWEVDCAGRRRDLVFARCVALRPTPSSRPEAFQAVTPADESCPWCDRDLLYLVSIGLDIFEREPSRRLEVTTCDVCTAFTTVFGVSDTSGHGRWSPASTRPKYIPDDSQSWSRLPHNCADFGPERPAHFAASQFLPTTFSQVGGYPTWIQDAVYPKCPRCSESMVFLAQIDHSEFEDLAEGMFYAFHCADCGTTATSYQQT